ncbi:MAG TPA: hypothetical protein PKN80_05315, partial [bacterium]|nr:hypothetical protein [bacterium]
MARRMVSAIMVLLLLALWCSAGEAGMREAEELYRQKKFVEAEAEIRKVLQEKPDAGGGTLQLLLGHTLNAQK